MISAGIDTGSGTIALATLRGREETRSILEDTGFTLQRAGFEQPLVFTGWAAMNTCIINLLRERISGEVILPAQPQLVGAPGAALDGLIKEI